MLVFKKVETPEDIKVTAQMAVEVWNDSFVDMIGQAQVDYMLDLYQSEKAMTEQIASGYEYYHFTLGETVIGYFAIREEDDNTLFLSKLYLKNDYQGNGYARQAFEYIKEIGKKNGNTLIWLTTNKRNFKAITVYNKFGMRIIRSQETDIGNDFIMDDYVFGYAL